MSVYPYIVSLSSCIYIPILHKNGWNLRRCAVYHLGKYVICINVLICRDSYHVCVCVKLFSILSILMKLHYQEFTLMAPGLKYIFQCNFKNSTNICNLIYLSKYKIYEFIFYSTHIKNFPQVFFKSTHNFGREKRDNILRQKKRIQKMFNVSFLLFSQT